MRSPENPPLRSSDERAEPMAEQFRSPDLNPVESAALAEALSKLDPHAEDYVLQKLMIIEAALDQARENRSQSKGEEL